MAIEAVLGLAIVLAAGWLADLPPGADRAATGRWWPWLASGLIVLPALAGARWFARPASVSPVSVSQVHASGVVP